MIRYNIRTTDGAIVLVAGESYRWAHGDAGAVFLDILAAGNVVASFLDPQHVADNNSVYLPKPATPAGLAPGTITPVPAPGVTP